MPIHQCLGTNNREHLQDRRESSIKLDKEPAISVREWGTSRHLAPQNVQLMPEGRVLRFKPVLRLEWRGQGEPEQRKHYLMTVGDFLSQSMRIRLSVHTVHRKLKWPSRSMGCTPGAPIAGPSRRALKAHVNALQRPPDGVVILSDRKDSRAASGPPSPNPCPG